MSTKITKKAKAKKSAKAKPKKAPPKELLGPLFRVDIACPMKDKTTGVVDLIYEEHYPGRRGTADEPMARAIMEDIKRCGAGGRLVELDGTPMTIGNPGGKIIEIWASVGRLEEAAKEEDNNVSLTTL
jgi:hypothetical protein